MADRRHTIYFTVRTERVARLITPKTLGAFLDMIVERSFAFLKDC
jgi:hypothetical protein